MDYFVAIIFGIVQGITEFFPISSSGHLVILHNVFELPIGDELFFDVSLHLASLIAVSYFFRKEIASLFLSFMRSVFRKEHSSESKLGYFILIATVPAAFAGFFFDGLIEKSLRDPLVVVFMLVIVGILLLVAEKIGKKQKFFNDLSLKDSLIVGFAQALALIPGTSRSGITIIAGLSRNLNRQDAVKFSFLLSIPIIAGAVLASLLKVSAGDFAGSSMAINLLAFLASLISSFFAVRFIVKLSSNFSFNIFAYYRFLLAIIVLLFLNFLA